jgi:hypothetical protein
VSVKAKLGSKNEFDAVSQQLDAIIKVIEKELIP